MARAHLSWSSSPKCPRGGLFPVLRESHNISPTQASTELLVDVDRVWKA